MIRYDTVLVNTGGWQPFNRGQQSEGIQCIHYLKTKLDAIVDRLFNSGEPQKVSTQPPLLNPAQTAVAGVPAHMSAYVMAARRLGFPIPPNLAGMMAPTIGLGLPVPAVAVRSVMPAARPGAATTQYSRPAFVQRNQASNFFVNLYGPQNPALPTNPGATGTTPVQLAVCGHIFHRGCVKRAFKVSQSCPVCRKVSCWTDVKSLRSCCYANHV
jgi:hypothetical protein